MVNYQRITTLLINDVKPFLYYWGKPYLWVPTHHKTINTKYFIPVNYEYLLHI
jgi:hypothetical protein